MKKFFKLAFAIIVVVLLIVAIIAALNFQLLKRVYTGTKIDTVHDISWYEPKAELTPLNSAIEFISPGSLEDSQSRKFSQAIEAAEKFQSSALLAWFDGELIIEKYWEEYDAQQYTQSNSIHKSLLALAVGVAIQEGKITSITDPASKYLSDWIEQPHGAITIEHMLTMTTGMQLYPFTSWTSTKLLYGSDVSGVALEIPQIEKPGDVFNYNNAIPQLMVEILEQATGQSYEAYLQDKVWSKFAANPGYLWMDSEGGTPRGYCCLIAQPSDLLRLGILFLNKGAVDGEQVISSEWIDKVISPSKTNPNYGFYVWLGTPHTPNRKYSADASFGVTHSEPYLAEDLIFFDGFGGQRVYIVPSLELVIVRVGTQRFDFDDAIIPNRIIEALQK
ncbi:MAG: beta-lactamase family protein [Acidiferrobacterales bacterium]|nr:beta-lactamase family protein [Acidiferrobacterales bacterium]